MKNCIRLKDVKNSAVTCLLLLIFFSGVAGCGKFSLVPVTLKEVKDFVFGQHRSFSFPMEKVLPATARSLGEAGFNLERIEYFNDEGLLEARWENTLVAIELDSITPNATKATSKISRDSIMREYSLEDTIFDNVQKYLEANQNIPLSLLTQNMSKVHLNPDAKSPVIAYIGPGAAVEVVVEKGDWVEISLEKGACGYMESSLVR